MEKDAIYCAWPKNRCGDVVRLLKLDGITMVNGYGLNVNTQRHGLIISNHLKKGHKIWHMYDLIGPDAVVAAYTQLAGGIAKMNPAGLVAHSGKGLHHPDAPLYSGNRYVIPVPARLTETGISAYNKKTITIYVKAGASLDFAQAEANRIKHELRLALDTLLLATGEGVKITDPRITWRDQ